MPTLRRGMPIRRQGTNVQCAVGPFFAGAQGNYFFTVQHGMRSVGANRVVEANLDGFNWTPIGTYVTGIQDESADWAIVQLNNGVTIDATLPMDDTAKKFPTQAPKGEKAVGVGYSYQAGGPVLFESTTIVHGNLVGKVPNSPTVNNQIQCLTTGSRRADEGDSGMAVYNQKLELIGIEWAIAWDGPKNKHTFYVQPIGVVALSFVGKLYELEMAYHNRGEDTAEWQLARPLANFLGGDKARLEDPQLMLRFILSRIS